MKHATNDVQPGLFGANTPEMASSAAQRSRPVCLSKKQQAVLEYCHISGRITTAQAVELIGRNIYTNAGKYVGATLSTMVKRGLLVRVRPGVFVARTSGSTGISARCSQNLEGGHVFEFAAPNGVGGAVVSRCRYCLTRLPGNPDGGVMPRGLNTQAQAPKVG